MRVLHADAGRTLRGGQHQVLHLLPALASRGVEPHLLARKSSPLFEAAGRLGIPVSPLGAATLRRLGPRFDLLHCHDARSHTLAALFSPRPFVVSRRVAFPIGRGLFTRWKYGRASLLVAVSEAVAAGLRSAGIDPARITVVPDGAVLPPATSTLDGALVAAASSDPLKGNALLRRTGLDILFSTSLASDLAHARAFLYITASEGLGSAALLAMAHGVPVVASRIGGLPEIVIHEVTGLLVENDAAAITAAVTRLVENPAWAAALGAAGRRLVEERFTIEHVAEATLAAYRRVLL